jgi:hypothetical protein
LKLQFLKDTATSETCKKLKPSVDCDPDCDPEGFENDTVQKLIDESKQSFKGESLYAAYDFWVLKI